MTAKRVRPRPGQVCSGEECDRTDLHALGLCEMHYRRWLRRGDPEVVLEAGWYLTGADHPSWKGDEVGYKAVHLRLKVHRGEARSHGCAFCSGVAEEWAYDHTDPNEKTGAKGLRFSVDLDRYLPLCDACHKRFDREHERRVS